MNAVASSGGHNARPHLIVTPMSDRSHTFTISTTAGEECSHCGVTVETEHVEALTIGCPAGGCTDPANHGEACVFVLADAEGRVECSYCERPGDPRGQYVPMDRSLLDFIADHGFAVPDLDLEDEDYLADW